MARTDRLVLLLAALAACDADVLPGAPRPVAVAPARGFSAVDTIVEITGDDFHVEPVQQVDAGGSSVDASFRAWLGATELAEVTWIDGATLRARVPAGIPLGTHDLAVEGPYGRGGVSGAYQAIAGVPTSLGIALTWPVEVALGEDLQITVRASNTGTSLVQGVLPEVVFSGAGAVDPVALATTALDVPPGEWRDFALRYRAIAAGAVVLQASVEGTDPRTDELVSAATSVAVAITPAMTAQVIAADPFMDASSPSGPTTFAFVTAYAGALYAGPNRTGTRIARMQPDGTAPESLELSFSRDPGTGSTSDNDAYNAALQYTSIGFTGCVKDTTECGPDNENGRGFLASATFAGDEWLVIGGARSDSDLAYVYMTRDTASPLSFSFVDLSAALGGNTHGFSAVRAAGGRLYLGFPDSGGSRPYGLALLNAPTTPPGLNAVVGPLADVVNVNLHDAYDKLYVGAGTKEAGSFANISIVDAIAELNDRVYFFNDIGCLVSKSAAPDTWDDFLACSPALDPAYVPTASIEPTREYDIEPRERAWPATAIWNGRLYAIRNTTTGPQLWACDPAGGADPVVCDRSDWTLVAADAFFRTRLGTGATHATLLLATPTHLYVGFDDAVSGVHLFRTAVPKPAVASDFSGDGCVAGTLGCVGIGGAGFGLGPAVSRIFDATAIASDVVVTAGNGTGVVRVLRISP